MLHLWGICLFLVSLLYARFELLLMHLLSYILNSLWNGSRIVINSSFQPLVIHNITCTISMHSCNASQHLHPYLCMHIYNIYSHFSYAFIQCITTRFIKYLNAYPLNATLHWFRNTMHSTYHAWPNHHYLIWDAWLQSRSSVLTFLGLLGS